MDQFFQGSRRDLKKDLTVRQLQRLARDLVLKPRS